MKRPERIAILDNGIQASLLSSLLDEEGIRHHICSYHDSAYDGLFQTERGWGHIEAAPENGARILEIIEELRKSGQSTET